MLMAVRGITRSRDDVLLSGTGRFEESAVGFRRQDVSTDVS